MSSSYDSYSVKSVPSTSNHSDKRRWRDLGLSGVTTSGFANLLRSARKSTDSLRSAASATSSRARSQTHSHKGSNATSVSIEKNSYRNSVNKDLPPDPRTPNEANNDPTRRSDSSSAASRIIHDVPEEPPLEYFEMPPEAELDPSVKLNKPSTKAETQQIDREQNNRTPTNESEYRKRELTSPTESTTRKHSITMADLPPSISSRTASLGMLGQDGLPTRSYSHTSGLSEGGQVPTSSIAGWTAEQDEVDTREESGSKTPTNDDKQSVTNASESLQRLGSSAKSVARRSFTRIRKKSNASTHQDSAKSAAAAISSSSQHPMPVSATDNVAAATASSSIGAGTQWAGNKIGGGDGNTIAQLYAVFGLPKDPSVWTLAEEDCVIGVHHLDGAIDRFWRPEVLGCSICPPPAEVLGHTQASSASLDEQSGASKWEGRTSTKDEKKSQSPKFIEMNDGRGATEKAETARVLSKALKLSFTREVEVVAEQGHYPPKATSHTFSFSVPTIPSSGEAYERTADGRKVAMATGVSVGGAANGVGEGYGLTSHRNGSNNGYGNSNDEGPRLATFYGVALTVWSAADEKRAKVIRKELAKAKKQSGGNLSKSNAEEGTNGTEAESSGLAAARGSSDSVFFMPYAICIVSRFPLYNLLGDWNKMAWHKYSRNIEMHNQLMSTILRHPAPRLGEEISVGSPEKDVSFHCTFPGAVEWGTGLIGIDFTMWPLFSTLSLDNILTICEIALGHNGRILFISSHPALLGMAVETLRYLVEQSGWRGVVHQICHARDVRIYLEDPGSWIIGINAELRGLVQPPAQVCTVDLDMNRVTCNSPPLNAISTKGLRERKRKRLLQAVYVNSVDYHPPREFIDAYPGSRFRPLSRMITRDLNSAYEQLPQPQWWNQTVVVQAFDNALREDQKSTFLKKMLKSRRNTRSVVASESEIAAIMALRKRASTFVDARDGLENKIGRLNKRLAFLMSESEMWRAQFGKIQVLVDRLTKEANDLRSKVDKERRESKRLSSRLAQRDIEHVQLQLQLKDTEQAREEALGELIRMKTAMESVEQEREAMMEEIRAVLSGGGNIEDVNMSVSRLDLPSFNILSRSSSPTGSQVSMTPSQAAEYVLKSRAMAEARISEGRPGRNQSRTNSRLSSQQGHRRSMSQDRGERDRNGSFSGSVNSHVNHFPDEQMNYEIQQRTNIVTDQISRIQQQLESTLTNLEGRRSGTYEREVNRRQRRGSNASINSRYEYRSSVGHGGLNNGEDSLNGHTIEDGRTVESKASDVKESAQDRSLRAPRRRKERSAAPPTASSQSLRDAYASSTTSHASLGIPPAIQPKSSNRPRISSVGSNGNKNPTSPTETNNRGNPLENGINSRSPPRSPEAEVTPGILTASNSGDSNSITQTLNENGNASSPVIGEIPASETNPSTVTPVLSHEDFKHGVASQPLLTALQQNSQRYTFEKPAQSERTEEQEALQEISAGQSEGNSHDNAHQNQSHNSHDASHNTNSGNTSPTLPTGIPAASDAESLLTKNGWTVDTADVKNVTELSG
ncbi:hypothetical protein L7F22_003058 [Adiantum nelumboides]|nr:hypothetical protein [Adiantum nelumboides]